MSADSGAAKGDESTPAAFEVNNLLAEANLAPLDSVLAGRFQDYCSLLLRWNARFNLTAIRDQESILARHFVESIACASALPAQIRTLLDFGSGAGFPGIPIALCRPDLVVTLAESQGKKAAFLQQAVRVLGVSATVHCGRAEKLDAQFDCVTLRAVERMPQAVEGAAQLIAPGGWLVVMTTTSALESLKSAAGAEFSWSGELKLPGGVERVVALGQREKKSQA